MAIQGIEQPEIIQIDATLRLRKYDDEHDFALAWYQDEETVWLVDGNRNPYTPERLAGMYRYLNEAGELYFIEVLENGTSSARKGKFWQMYSPSPTTQRALMSFCTRFSLSPGLRTK